MGIEFNGNVNKDLFIGHGVQSKETNRIDKTDVKFIDNKHIGEFGDKLLEQVQPRFIQTAKIPETDAKELNEMFAMAGIKNPKMPTVAQYASISGHVGTAVKSLDEVTTTNNAEDLFKTRAFNALNGLFGIA